MSSAYFNELNEKDKLRYSAKLSFNGCDLPDPLDGDIRNRVFLCQLLPAISMIDIYEYVVNKNNVYTKAAFKNHTDLPCYRYVVADKIRNLGIYRNEQLAISVIVGDVQGSQSLNKIHCAWIVVKNDGEIVNGHCTCKAGLGETCAHVSAILFLTLNLVKSGEKPSCTSLPCSWNKISKDVEPSPTVNIQFSKPEKKRKLNTKKNVPVSMASETSFGLLLVNLKKALPTAAMLQVLSDDEETESEDETKSLVKETLTFAENVRNKFNFLPTHSADFEWEKSYHYLCHMSDNDIENMKLATVGHGEGWMAERRGRLTASNFGRILRSKTSDSILMDLMGYTNDELLANVASLKWGRDMEPVALELFQNILSPLHVNLIIRSVGLWVCKNANFLAVTPDGIISCDCHPDALLEIKCPYTQRYTCFSDIDKKDFFLDEFGQLKEEHVYYDQVQGQMGITEIHTCYFVTYTEKSLVYDVVSFDEMKWSLMKEKLRKFFFTIILPEIVHGTKKQELCDANDQCICEGSKSGTVIKCVSCKRAFHRVCIKYWKRSSWCCTACKTSLVN